jgi:hypothetical protein
MSGGNRWSHRVPGSFKNDAHAQKNKRAEMLQRIGKIHDQKGFAAGMMFAALGVACALIATTYRMGTASRMGPGYFPFWLGVLLAVLGTVVVLRSFRSAEPSTIGRVNLARLAIIGASVLLFGATLKHGGLILAVALLVGLSSSAGREFSWRMTAGVALALIVFSVAVFVYGLDLRIPLFPSLPHG